MSEDFVLTDKIKIGILGTTQARQYGFVREEDVKEFIRLLKEKLMETCEQEEQLQIINKLAGVSLI